MRSEFIGAENPPTPAYAKAQELNFELRTSCVRAKPWLYTTRIAFWHRHGNVTCIKWVKVFHVGDQIGLAGWVRSKYLQPITAESC